jgi:hypothetical protein
LFTLHHPNLAACQRGIHAMPDQRLIPAIRPGSIDRVAQVKLAPAALQPFGTF